MIPLKSPMFTLEVTPSQMGVTKQGIVRYALVKNYDMGHIFA